MKKLLLLALLIPLSASAGLWDSVSGAFKKTIEPVAYAVAASGSNIRVYEWELQGNPNVTCVYIATETDARSHCYYKEIPTK